jgi:hypothetical protein
MGNSNAMSHMSGETRTMDYFDRLPRSVRAVVANARFDWTLHRWLLQFERGEIRARDLVEHINETDRLEAAKTRKRAWGPDYPVLKGELPHAPRQRKARR